MGVSNHRRLDYLLNRLFKRRSKKTSKAHVTGLCEGKPPVTGGFLSQRDSNAENVSIWWRHYEQNCTQSRRLWMYDVSRLFSTLWPSDATWRRRSWPTQFQVMAGCLTALNHYLNQFWLTSSEVFLYSPDNNFTDWLNSFIMSLSDTVRWKQIHSWNTTVQYMIKNTQ